MISNREIVAGFESLGVTHIVWIPDSHLGRWESEIVNSKAIKLVRVAREGEAFVLAAGLHIGGAKPLVIVQCTGLFEAGDALRNVIHDLKIPLKCIIGVRSRKAYLEGRSNDNCAYLTEPIVQAWGLDYNWIDPETLTPAELQVVLDTWWHDPEASALLWVE